MKKGFRYHSISLSDICFAYAKRHFRKELSVTEYWIDPIKNVVIFQLIEYERKGQS